MFINGKLCGIQFWRKVPFPWRSAASGPARWQFHFNKYFPFPLEQFDMIYCWLCCFTSCFKDSIWLPICAIHISQNAISLWSLNFTTAISSERVSKNQFIDDNPRSWLIALPWEWQISFICDYIFSQFAIIKCTHIFLPDRNLLHLHALFICAVAVHNFLFNTYFDAINLFHVIFSPLAAFRLFFSRLPMKTSRDFDSDR